MSEINKWKKLGASNEVDISKYKDVLDFAFEDGDIQNVANNLINIYSSDVYDLEEILKRKNYLTSYKDVTACIASIMFSAFVIGFSNYIVYSIMLINNYDFSIENNLIATCSSIIVSLCICLWLYYIKVLFLSNDFDKYNTNELEIKLIDQYIELRTGLSDDKVLRQAKRRMMCKKCNYKIKTVRTK